MKNIIQVVGSIRVELQNMNLKKTGKNGNRFSYYELGDFLPQLNALELKHGIISYVIFETFDNKDYASLMVSNGDVNFLLSRCSTAEAKLQGGASPIQEKGAEITYIRRYLYMLAYGIVENDWVDCVTEQPETISSEDRNKLYKIAGAAGYDKETIQKQCKTKYKKELKYISKEQYDQLYSGYKSILDKKENK